MLSNGLGLQDGMPTGITAGIGATAAGSVETNREAAQNKVNALQQQLSAARVAGNKRMNLAPQLESNVELYERLQRLKANLGEISTAATE